MAYELALAFQRTAGNAAVAQLLSSPTVVQRCGSMPCDCDDEDKAGVDVRRSVQTTSPAAPAVQRYAVCPVGVDPTEGTGCYEMPDPAPAESRMTPANDNAASEIASESTTEAAEGAGETAELSTAATEGTEGAIELAEGAEVAVDVAEGVEVATEIAEGAELATGLIEAGLVTEGVPVVGQVVGTALILGGLGYLAYKALSSDDRTPAAPARIPTTVAGPRPEDQAPTGSTATETESAGQTCTPTETEAASETTAADQTCTDAERADLQDAVNWYCKRLPRGCREGMSPAELRSFAQRNEQCARARRTINRECFNGGDAGHRTAEQAARDAAENCWDLYRRATRGR